MLEDVVDRAKGTEADLELAGSHILDANNHTLAAESKRTSLENAAKRAQQDVEISKAEMAIAKQDVDDAWSTLEKMHQDLEDIQKAVPVSRDRAVAKEAST